MTLKPMPGAPTKTCGCLRSLRCLHFGVGGHRLVLAPDPNPCACACGHPCLTRSRLWQRVRQAESAYYREPTPANEATYEAASAAWRNH